MNFGFFKYITLGFEVFNAVTTIIAMFKAPALLTTTGVWEVIRPVLDEISVVAKVKIDENLAEKITDDAVNLIRNELRKKSLPAA